MDLEDLLISSKVTDINLTSHWRKIWHRCYFINWESVVVYSWFDISLELYHLGFKSSMTQLFLQWNIGIKCIINWRGSITWQHLLTELDEIHPQISKLISILLRKKLASFLSVIMNNKLVCEIQIQSQDKCEGFINLIILILIGFNS